MSILYNPSQLTLADYILPLSRSRALTISRDAVLIFSFSIFISLCAQISFILPFTVVPVTLQTLGVLLTGAALGSRRGGLAVLAYLTEGATGLPVFSGGASGILYLFGFTGGYLWAFPVASFITGWLCEKGFDRNTRTCALAMLPGTLIIYLLGVSWLAYSLHIPVSTAITKGALPFIAGDTLKIFIAAGLLPTVWKLISLKKP